MGCDYYIYTVLKIVHSNGVSLIKLSEKPVYLYGYESDDDFTTHPLKRRPKIDHMKPECEDVLIYKKGESGRTESGHIIDCNYISQYMELIEELIKDYSDFDYKTKNKIIQNNMMFEHDVNGESLKDINNVQELYIVELRAWRN